MSVTDIDEDVSAAVKALWMATPGLGQVLSAPGLPDFTCGELKAGALPAGLGDGKKGTLTPYASLVVEKGRDNERQTGGGYRDYRKVTLAVWASKADASRALAVMLATFSLNLQATDVPQVLLPTLVMPSGARFLRWWPLNDGAKAPAKDKKFGTEVWTATVVGEVATARTIT